VRRYNWHSAGYIGWHFPEVKCKYIFKQNILKQFYQTALEKRDGLKLP